MQWCYNQDIHILSWKKILSFLQAMRGLELIMWYQGQCTVKKIEYFAQLSAAVKIDLGLDIQSLSKCPFLNVFSKTYRPTKVDVLGNWEVIILFRNSWLFFLASYRGTLNWLLMSLKVHQSWRHHINHAVSMNLPALLWQLLKLFPVVC